MGKERTESVQTGKRNEQKMGNQSRENHDEGNSRQEECNQGGWPLKLESHQNARS